VTTRNEAVKIVGRLKAAGLTLAYSPETDRLNVKPTAKLTPELVALVKEHKAGIVSALPAFERDGGGLDGVLRNQADVFTVFRERRESRQLTEEEAREVQRLMYQEHKSPEEARREVLGDEA
jgi:hypothetical protein